MALVLTRREGEGVTLLRDGRIFGHLVVKDTRYGATRLVLDFPSDVKVMRDELLPRAGTSPAANGGAAEAAK